MLLTPSADVLRSVYLLSRMNEWKAFSGFLAEERAKVIERLVATSDEVTLRQLQGRAKCLDELEAMVRDARDDLEKLGVTTL